MMNRRQFHLDEDSSRSARRGSNSSLVSRLVPEPRHARLLAPATVPLLESLREHNPLLFDFVLKRQLRAGSARFADPVFETRPFFERTPA